MRTWRDSLIALVRFAGIMMILFSICTLHAAMVALLVSGLYVALFGYWVLPLLLKDKDND